VRSSSRELLIGASLIVMLRARPAGLVLRRIAGCR
jgi:hypothetical protein